MSVEDVQLVAYDPAWPRMFANEARRLRKFLGDRAVLRLEHVGSTAIPGMSAKPVLDMLAEIPSFEAARQLILPRLLEDGWEYLWRDDRPPGHMMFIRRDATGRRTHHLHLAPAGHPLFERVSFRDYLRAYPEEARRYEELKIRLAASHPDDREAYTAGKSDYVKQVTAKAIQALGR